MADPELVLQRVSEQEEPASIVVVSAPGIDTENPIKLTDLLIQYKDSPSKLTKHAVLHRLGRFAYKVYGDSTYFMETAESELDEYTINNWPLESLGELWSARAFASLSGYEILDPKEVILFDENHKLDIVKCIAAFKVKINPDKMYVLPGFYGGLPSGDIGIFSRGGSDISGAIAAVALEASAYRNWSDVPGFLIADPRRVASQTQRLVERLTYEELELLSDNGNELLHNEVVHLLKATGIPIIMCDTFSGKHGTIICAERTWEKSPVAGITLNSKEQAQTIHVVGEGLKRCPTTRNIVLERLTAGLAHSGVQYDLIHSGELSMGFCVSDTQQRQALETLYKVILTI